MLNKILFTTFLLCFTINNGYTEQKEATPLQLIPPSLNNNIPQNYSITSKEKPEDKTTITKGNLQQSKKLATELKKIKPLVYANSNNIIIDTGYSNGLYNEVGNIICSLINYMQKGKNINCDAKLSIGSIKNINDLRDAKANLALVQAGFQENAFKGTKTFSKIGPFKKLRFVFSLYYESVALIVRADSDIHTLDDVKGKIVDMGRKESASNYITQTVITAKNWSQKSFKSTLSLSDDQKPEALCYGKVDAIFIASGNPNSIIKNITSLCETSILNLDDQDIRKFVQNNKAFSMTTISGGLYLGSPKDINTFGEKATLVTTSDVSDSLIYEVTKLFFENLSNVKKIHRAFKPLNPMDMVEDGKIAPIHNGALIYYKEKGYIK